MNKTYYRVLIRATNHCNGREPNLYIYFSKVRVTATAEPMDLSDYHITKEQYRGLPTATLKNEKLTEQDKEAIKERLLPRIAGMIGEWGIEPRSTFIEFI